MKIGILKEILPGETRVAATPETVSKMVKAGFEVMVEKDAGKQSAISDTHYLQAGANIAKTHEAVFLESDVILKVNRPLLDKISGINEVSLLKNNSSLIAPIYPKSNTDLLFALKEKNITTFALERMPRIARAQSMDILSSMSSVAGYKSIIMAADRIDKLFPMMTTAAGTITPAKVLVIGAGVAGLQAIATAKRLGAVVIAFDTRPIAGEQVKSLGAEFVSLETSHEQSQDALGYAKEQSIDFYQHEQETIGHYSQEADVIVTTALIPGKRAPLLITESMVEQMKQGSVIVDLAAEHLGNCELTEPGNIVTKYGVTIIGTLNLPALLPIDTSRLYSRNVLACLNYLAPSLNNHQFDLDDDIIKHTLITHQGEILMPEFASMNHVEGHAHAS